MPWLQFASKDFGFDPSAESRRVLIPMTIFSWSVLRFLRHTIVTGNAKDFPANWAGTRVVSARQFLDAISEIQDEPTV
jgi:hypothetical protein